MLSAWRGTFIVGMVPNLLLLFHPPAPKSSKARRPQFRLSSWLCFAKSSLDFLGVRGDGNQGFEVSKTKVTGHEERWELFACSSPRWTTVAPEIGNCFGTYMRQEGGSTEKQAWSLFLSKPWHRTHTTGHLPGPVQAVTGQIQSGEFFWEFWIG